MANVFFQSNNGTDTTTDLNTVSATSIPIFSAVDFFSNHSDLFDETSSTEITSNFDGLIRLSSCVYIVGSGNRDQIRSQFYINGSPIGPVGAGGFVFDSGKADEDSMVIPTYTYPISTNDVVTLKTSRVEGTSPIKFASANTSYVMIEALSEDPTLMGASQLSTRTIYNLASEEVKDIFINLLVLTKDSSANKFTQDVSVLTTEQADEYEAYLRKLGCGVINNSYTTFTIAW